MPANRSRNEKWREALDQIADRGGCLEISVDHPPSVLEQTPDLVWRVRILKVGEHEVLVEKPTAAGKALSILEGVPLIGVMTIGQNRWMFRTRALGHRDGPSPWPPALLGLRLAMPAGVERCRRREFTRVSNAEVHLPRVDCWPVLDIASVGAAELATRTMVLDIEAQRRAAYTSDSEAFVLPEVGPLFHAQLLNIGGGGMGLLVDKSESSAVDRSRLLWLRLDLRPAIAAPLGMAAKIVHTHLESTQDVYAGIAFDFSPHSQHREFIVEQVQRYINRMQLESRAAA